MMSTPGSTRPTISRATGHGATGSSTFSLKLWSPEPCARGRGAGDVEPHPYPAASAPQERLHEADGLHPARRDGLPRLLQQPVAQPQPVRRLGHGEVVVAGELREHAEQRHAAEQTRKPTPAGAGGEQRHHHERDAADEQEERLGAQQQRQHEVARAARVASTCLGRLLGVVRDAGGAGDHLVAQLVGLAQRQELQRHLRVAGTRPPRRAPRPARRGARAAAAARRPTAGARAAADARCARARRSRRAGRRRRRTRSVSRCQPRNA